MYKNIYRFTCDNCLKSKGKKRKENKFTSKSKFQSFFYAYFFSDIKTDLSNFSGVVI